jgi:hypothetical protein
MILNFVEVLEWVNRPNFRHASSFRCCRWGKAIFLTFVNLASLSHDFLSAVDLAICGCWLCGFCFVDLSLTRGGGGGRRTDWFLGCCAALASWLLCLLLSFDYQNPCLLFLKLQVQDQNDYFRQTVWGLFSKFFPLVFLEFYAWLFGFVKSSFMRWFCLFGGSFLYVIWLYVIWIFHLLYGGLNKLLEVNIRMHRM